MSLVAIGAGLLVVGGLINAIPPVSEHLRRISGGRPILQVLIGVGSAIVGLMLVTKVV